jgi:hypothetical protein
LHTWSWNWEWCWSWTSFDSTGKVGSDLSELRDSLSINDLTALSVSDDGSNLLVVSWGQDGWSLLLLGNWLTQFEGSGSSRSDNDAVFNIVEFLSESWSSNLDASVGHGGLSNINKFLGHSLSISELRHWNWRRKTLQIMKLRKRQDMEITISDSGNLDWDLVVSIANLLGHSDGWSMRVLKLWLLSILQLWLSVLQLWGWSILLCVLNLLWGVMKGWCGCSVLLWLKGLKCLKHENAYKPPPAGTGHGLI